MTNRHPPTLLALAGMAGAAGVAIAAAGSHGGETNLTTAATFLLLHAAALIGISLLPRRLSQIAGFVLAIGVALFAGDLAARVAWGHALFPMAAPIGGGGLILGWLLLAGSAFGGRSGR